MKKLLALVLVFVIAALSCIGFAACGNNNGTGSDNGGGTGNIDSTNNGSGTTAPEFVVGICQLTQHAALDAATQGFIDALKAEFGDRIAFDLQNASGDINLCTTIVNSFVNKKVDLIMANATPALQAAYNATETIPILGTSITEYGVALGLDNFAGVVGSNVSGTSDLAPLTDMILEICPDTKVVGIVYCSAEPNSKYQVEKMTELLEAKGITVKPYPFSDSNDIAPIVTTAAANCDVLYIPTDNTAASCAETIGSIVIEKRIPVFTGEENPAKVCGVASLTISYYDLGWKTGEMAAKILKGEADISEMPIEYAPAVKKYNKEMCDLLGITVPDYYEEMK